MNTTKQSTSNLDSRILQSNPKASYLAYRDEIDAAVARVLNSGWYILGEEVSIFEKEFANYIGVGDAIGVASGTDAIHVALKACGVGVGDVVFTVSHTAVATVAAIELCGATPVFVDIDPVSFVMDMECLTRAIETTKEGRPKAVVPVHLYGQAVDMTSLVEIAERYEIFVVEDCAQAHGAMWRGQKVGSWGHLAAFSFYPTKNLGALGDGGAVVTDDAGLAERVRLLREYGWQERYVSSVPGFNSRLDEIQAAVLRIKLRSLDNDNEQRRQIAEHYTDALMETHLALPQQEEHVHHVYHQYVIKTRDRDSLRDYLKEQGIGTLIHYPVPVHKQPAYERFHKQDLPHTESIARQILSFPMYPELKDTQAQFVAQCVARWKD